MTTLPLPLALARESLQYYLTHYEIMKVEGDFPAYLVQRRAGVFVTYVLPDRTVRASFGTVRPTKQNVAEEIVHAAVNAACYDPLHQPVKLSEIKSLSITVDIIRDFEQINLHSTLHPEREGILVENTAKQSGVILPGQMVGEDMRDIVMAACHRAKINFFRDLFKIFKFTTDQYHE